MTYMGFESEYETSELVLFGAPFDGTVSYRPGTRFAPAAMRAEFEGLETYSPYFDMDLEAYSLFDGGDLDLPFGSKERALDMIYDTTKKILDDNKIPLMIGGEHLVSYGPMKAVAEKYDDLAILHFDAHADLRSDYMDEAFSHATVIRRIWDIVGDEKIYQFGIRSGTRDEFEFAKAHTVMEKFSYSTLASLVSSLSDRPVYITIDLDVLDPSVFSGTGTPEPGGLTFHEMMEIIVQVSGLNIVGADIVELSPHYDASGVSTAVACKVLRELTFAILRGR
ncbi:agmatinase [Fusibacter sp. JL216-2]|uniref:agmatinase n=1 Tax=Fusibacter sp. JL216-2 TaxID=3071453 RepID=UPI003D33E343